VASIRQIIEKSYHPLEGPKKAGAWEIRYPSTHAGEYRIAQLWHYNTCMLTWDTINPADPAYLDYDIGWGSVSDQNGMNTAFRILRIPLYYNRAGGASIEKG
jgi:hypothetical protein